MRERERQGSRERLVHAHTHKHIIYGHSKNPLYYCMYTCIHKHTLNPQHTQTSLMYAQTRTHKHNTHLHVRTHTCTYAHKHTAILMLFLFGTVKYTNIHAGSVVERGKRVQSNAFSKTQFYVFLLPCTCVGDWVLKDVLVQ